MKRSERAAPEPSVGVQLAPDQMTVLPSREVSNSFQRNRWKRMKNNLQNTSFTLQFTLHVKKKPVVLLVPAVKQLLVAICFHFGRKVGEMMLFLCYKRAIYK